MSDTLIKTPTPSRAPLSRRWKIFLAVAIIAGFVLRLIYVEDMEYKEDEEYNFTQSQSSAAWAWIGMPSGVYIPNPGMSVWAFKALAWIARASTPTALAHAVQLFALIGICALLPFARRVLRATDDPLPWLWAMALALVNPFAVFYQRKLWPEPILPFFSVLMLAGWWRRELWLGAFIWGFFGAWLGQIHMSGFFYGAAFLICTLLWGSTATPRPRVRWGAWFVGSVLGALPLIPWAYYAITHPIHETINRGWAEILQFKFWVFWVTNPTGLHLGNPLGLLRGPTNWDQISDFVRYPIIAGHATYLNLAAHLLAAAASVSILGNGLKNVGQRALRFFSRPTWRELSAPRPDLAIALTAGFWGFGLLLTASAVMIRRYYLMVGFPLEFLWLVAMALAAPPNGGLPRKPTALALLWGAQLFISACFVGYVHVNQGATGGDYGDAFHVVMERRAQASTKTPNH